jgi:hypothetical protein
MKPSSDIVVAATNPTIIIRIRLVVGVWNVQIEKQQYNKILSYV